MLCRISILSAFLHLVVSSSALAEEPEKAAPPDAAALHEKFTQAMENVRLAGKYTIVGRDKEPQEEQYVIQSAVKLPEGDYWLFKARIKYGDKDVTLPLPLEVKWAGTTPVITLSDMTIPGLGTFSARVVIDGDRYAGTWQHGKVGGHLYGRIEKNEPAAAPKEE